jgi:multiple sugar transport system permease protein
MRVVSKIFKLLILIVVITAVLTPIYWWVSVALTRDAAETPGIEVGPIIGFTLMYSIPTALVAAFIHTLIAYGLAYGLARGRFPFREEIKLITFLALLVPATVIAGPLYWMNTKIGFHGTFAATFLAMWIIPWLSVVFYLYLGRLPDRMEQYASMDGLSRRQVFTELVLPYSYRAIIAIFLLAFLVNYHSLFAAAAALPVEMFTRDPESTFSYLPVMVSLFRQAPEVVSSSLKLYVALLFQIPSIVVLPFLLYHGIPMIRTIITGRIVHRKKPSAFGIGLKEPGVGRDRV